MSLDSCFRTLSPTASSFTRLVQTYTQEACSDHSGNCVNMVVISWRFEHVNTAAVEDMFVRTAEETTCSSYSHHSLLLHPCWIGVREPVKGNTII